MKNNWVKIGDVVIVSVILVLSVTLLFVQRTNREKGSMVLIRMSGLDDQVVPLEENRIIELKSSRGEVSIEIKDQHACILHSSCPHQYCVKMGQLTEIGEIAVCVPNQCMIEITGNQPSVVDAYTM